MDKDYIKKRIYGLLDEVDEHRDVNKAFLDGAALFYELTSQGAKDREVYEALTEVMKENEPEQEVKISTKALGDLIASCPD